MVETFFTRSTFEILHSREIVFVNSRIFPLGLCAIIFDGNRNVFLILTFHELDKASSLFIFHAVLSKFKCL